MIDDISDISSYYDNATSQELDRLTRHQLERDITYYYLGQYLPSEGNILEIGTGAGRIAIDLAKQGHRLTAVDISEKMIQLCKRRASEEGLDDRVSCLVRDARKLGELKETPFDAVLMLGPLYHLIYRKDRETALKEAFNCLKPGGIVFSSFISRYGIWGDVMKKIPEAINRQADLDSVLRTGRDAEKPPVEGFRGYFAKASEIPPLHERIGFKTLLLAGAEPCISADDESYNSLEGRLRGLWFDLMVLLSTEKSTIAASRHILYIGQRPI
jgi:S-adenosylmethionine-dependent methyltransferase